MMGMDGVGQCLLFGLGVFVCFSGWLCLIVLGNFLWVCFGVFFWQRKHQNFLEDLSHILEILLL